MTGCKVLGQEGVRVERILREEGAVGRGFPALGAQGGVEYELRPRHSHQGTSHTVRRGVDSPVEVEWGSGGWGFHPLLLHPLTPSLSTGGDGFRYRPLVCAGAVMVGERGDPGLGEGVEGEGVEGEGVEGEGVEGEGWRVREWRVRGWRVKVCECVWGGE